MATASLFAFIFLSHLRLIYSTGDDIKTLPICPQSFLCGNHRPISFPFTNTRYGHCGIVIDCDHPVLKVQLGSQRWYHVKGTSDKFLEIHDPLLEDHISHKRCNDTFKNLTLPDFAFVSFTFTFLHNLTFFKCNNTPQTEYASYNKCKGYSIYYKYSDHEPPPASLLHECSAIQLPLKLWPPPPPHPDDPFSILTATVPIELHISRDCLHCQSRGGQCQNIDQTFQCTVKKKGQEFNSFAYKLGKGGYGGVYKGKLQNGRLVAVKVLTDSKGNGEEFTNEVVCISRTSHVNVVTLLGFCFEGTKRALIYEFMPNGSLEKFIYDESSSIKHQLGWETLYQIAVGIARGLEYLHRGCNTRILHFDMKPYNILLDEDFCPKIADFGPSKLCPNKDGIISMLGARGTIGYIAPEVVSRSFGGISHKSNVYSYGMMVLEMVGGRKNIDVGVDHTSEIYFPHWIYNRVELDEDLGLHGIMNEEENERAKKMIIVGLWCIQTDPSNRPSINKVMEMLEGSLDSLQIPPKPFLSSPPRPPADSSTIQLL
ncbi:PR5-like receptor kinase [Cornus florida]|uniref:PR5-like receptor kinase n=1 Tax=Cornus florida TaxID=4283 RepID=UPI002896C7B5|nr:PR5-like receptor kinase [Cornus florida]